MTKEVYGEAINDIETMLRKSEELFKIFGIEEQLTNIAELENALKKAFDSLPNQKRAQERIELENLQRKIQELNNKSFITALESCITKFNLLVSDKQNLSNLNLDDFLRQAERVINSALELKECPLCEQKIVDKDSLLKRVIERYHKLPVFSAIVTSSSRFN